MENNLTEITFRSDADVELLELLGDEQMIVRSARVSTKGSTAEKEEAEGLLRFLWREGHTSPFEYPDIHLRITAPKFTTIQILKHRLSTINEESMRYREMKPVFFVPGDDRKVKQVGKHGNYEFVYDARALADAQFAHKYIADTAWEYYKWQLNRGVAREVARGVLPLSMYSSLIIKMNLRSWINFVKLRTQDYGSHAQHEIAQVGDQVKLILEEHFPTVMSAVNGNVLN